MSTVRRAPARRLRAPDGTILCSCGCGEVPKPPRRNWFSSDCVTRWREKNDPAFLRAAVFQRDRGICALCGCDSEAAFARWQAAATQASRMIEKIITTARFDVDFVDGRWRLRDPSWPTAKETHRRREELRQKWLPPGQWTSGRSSAWDADHILPVSEGGGLCGLENYRTLCHPCHKQVTADLAARRAARAREAKAALLPAPEPFNPESFALTA